MSDIFTNEVIGPLTDTELRATPVPVSGSVTVTPSGTQNVSVVSSVEVEVKNDSGSPVPVNGTVNVGTVSGTVNVISAVASSSTVTQVTLPASTNTTLLAANAGRKSAIIFCPKTAVFIKLGATASGTSFSYKTPGADTTLTITGYTGQIDAFGPATLINVTELA